ncbi:MAG TPA: hypothetical protein VGR37_23735 [Longimicrobiaceae bacterium]|nr:hypothetical protein [Longimicrobiaceae bacterium]
MPDIRLVRPRGSHLWLLIGGLVTVALAVLAFSLFFGDPTEAAETARVGARADFGAKRAPVIPVEPTPFEAVSQLSEADLGTLVRLTGVAESRVAGNSLWVRSAGGRRILVRFEPPPPEGTRLGIVPGGAVRLDGYIQKIAQAELKVRLDTLGVRLPRPTPRVGGKFGDLPDSGFLRVDSLFVKGFYVSVRPEALPGAGAPAAPATGAGR